MPIVPQAGMMPGSFSPGLTANSRNIDKLRPLVKSNISENSRRPPAWPMHIHGQKTPRNDIAAADIKAQV